MAFSFPVRVYYEDTDSGGVVYYANYLKFMERARTEYLRQLGFEQDQLIEQENIIFAVKSVNVNYHLPAKFNQLLDVTASVTEFKKASLLFEQKIIHQQDQRLLCSGSILIASLNAQSFKPCAIPQSIRDAHEH